MKKIALVVRLFIVMILLCLSVGLLVQGKKVDDFTELESVGSIMCLSCMGIE